MILLLLQRTGFTRFNGPSFCRVPPPSRSRKARGGGGGPGAGARGAYIIEQPMRGDRRTCRFTAARHMVVASAAGPPNGVISLGGIFAHCDPLVSFDIDNAIQTPSDANTHAIGERTAEEIR